MRWKLLFPAFLFCLLPREFLFAKIHPKMPPKKPSPKWAIYINNQPFDGLQIQSKGKLFVEKNGILRALELKEAPPSIPEGDQIVVKDVAYLWLPVAANLAHLTLFVNNQTRIIDLTRFKAAAPKNLGSPTIVNGGSSGSSSGSSSTSSPPPIRGGY